MCALDDFRSRPPSRHVLKNLVGFAKTEVKNLVGFANFAPKNLVGFAIFALKNLVGLKNCFIFAFNNDNKNDI